MQNFMLRVKKEQDMNYDLVYFDNISKRIIQIEKEFDTFLI